MEKTQNIHELSVSRDMISDILKELPVKSLLRLRCVSKLWRSIVDDPLFVQSHHIRSRTRPGGLDLLVVYSRDSSFSNSSYLCSADPEGGPVSCLVQAPFKECWCYFQSVNGLVCIDRYILNPSTRECLILPPVRMSVIADVERWENRVKFYPQYFLGFDPSTNRYKIVTICNISNIREKQTQFKILTLGTSLLRDIDAFELNSLWRDIDGFGRQFDIYNACFVTDVIYILRDDMILAFEVVHEKFRIMPLPVGAFGTLFPVQVREHLALIDREVTTIWTLEDYGKQLWSKQSLILPHGLKNNFIPIGTIHTGEFLFLSHPSKLFYYDLEGKTLRTARDLSTPPELPYQLCLTKHVECLHQLKDLT